MVLPVEGIIRGCGVGNPRDVPVSDRRVEFCGVQFREIKLIFKRRILSYRGISPLSV